MNITQSELVTIMPYAAKRTPAFVDPLNAAMEEFEINTFKRASAFLAQLAHESAELRYMEELADGSAYDHRADLGNTRPEAVEIAGSHGTTPGRWWKGHGPIQITGYDNHKACGEYLGLDLLNNPKLLTTPENGCRSSGWFWTKFKGLNVFADRAEFLTITKRINGGTNGWDSRLEYYNRALKVLGVLR